MLLYLFSHLYSLPYSSTSVATRGFFLECNSIKLILLRRCYSKDKLQLLNWTFPIWSRLIFPTLVLSSESQYPAFTTFTLISEFCFFKIFIFFLFFLTHTFLRNALSQESRLMCLPCYGESGYFCYSVLDSKDYRSVFHNSVHFSSLLIKDNNIDDTYI